MEPQPTANTNYDKGPDDEYPKSQRPKTCFTKAEEVGMLIKKNPCIAKLMERLSLKIEL